ncbi:MAG: lipid IV(A) 3-deoxy-D-manno-octulosonic acid transferase [Chromatiales bacterium]|nr:lipid IV(A) 3-deoxy-D-manno-octulosonic acid transferase [Chromatiales bacterium]
MVDRPEPPPTTTGGDWPRRMYTVVVYLMLPFALLRLFVRGIRAPDYWHRWRERFGLIEPVPSGGVWLHAVSVGEVQAVVPLVRELRKLNPEMPVTVTTTTPTGWRRVVEAMGEGVVHRFTPYDAPFAVRKFLERVRPRCVIIVETEIWPNLLAECRRRSVPVALANARLSQRSARGYARFPRLIRAALNAFSLIAAHDEPDAQRFRDLGATEGIVRVTGNIKFDQPLPASRREQSQALRRALGLDGHVWIAASTHEGEDEQILAAFGKVRSRVADCRLILVPRHPERFARVGQLVSRHGFETVLRSEQRPCAATTEVFVLDSMGELPLFYGLADLAFVGGSLVRGGGHNVLEPAALGVPVLFGPHMFNFAGIARVLLDGEGAREVRGVDELSSIVIGWFENPAERSRFGDNARAVVARNRGALGRLLAALRPLIRDQSISA